MFSCNINQDAKVKLRLANEYFYNNANFWSFYRLYWNKWRVVKYRNLINRILGSISQNSTISHESVVTLRMDTS